jgi:hypothetical protein
VTATSSYKAPLKTPKRRPEIPIGEGEVAVEVVVPLGKRGAAFVHGAFGALFADLLPTPVHEPHSIAF